MTTSFLYSAPGGRTSLSLRSSNPDPARRFVLTVSDGFAIGTEGLRDLACRLEAFADQVDEASAPKRKAPKKKKTQGGDA